MEQNSNYRVLSNVCVSCGVRIPDIDFEIKPAMRETYGLFLVTAGKGIFIIDGTVRTFPGSQNAKSKLDQRPGTNKTECLCCG